MKHSVKIKALSLNFVWLIWEVSHGNVKWQGWYKVYFVKNKSTNL